MVLEEFIKETLVSISKGIHSANEELVQFEGKKLGVDGTAKFSMEPFNRDKTQGYIIFDVAVTVNEGTRKKGEGGIKIAVARLGGSMENVEYQESVSRIKFHVMPEALIA